MLRCKKLHRVVCDKVCTYIAGSTICTSCVAGKYLVATNDPLSPFVCADCWAGKYSAADASTVCTECEAGKFSGAVGASTVDTCSNCQAGKFSGSTSQTSAASCTICGGGTYSLAGAANCTNCEAGKYQLPPGVADIPMAVGQNRVVLRWTHSGDLDLWALNALQRSQRSWWDNIYEAQNWGFGNITLDKDDRGNPLPNQETTQFQFLTDGNIEAWIDIWTYPWRWTSSLTRSNPASVDVYCHVCTYNGQTYSGYVTTVTQNYLDVSGTNDGKYRYWLVGLFKATRSQVEWITCTKGTTCYVQNNPTQLTGNSIALDSRRRQSDQIGPARRQGADQTLNTACIECAAGKYKATAGPNTACDYCEAGKYQATAGVESVRVRGREGKVVCVHVFVCVYPYAYF